MKRQALLVSLLMLLVLGSVLTNTNPSRAANFWENVFILQSSGGGLTLEPVQVDTKTLNQVLTKYEYPTLGNLMWTYGGQLFSETEKHLRYTNFYMTGALAASSPDGRYTRLSWSHGGLGVDQMFHIMKYLAFSAGGSISYGGLKLQLVNARPEDFEGAIGNPQQTVLTASNIILKPQIGIYVPVLPSVNIEFKAGYYFAYMPGSWKLSHKSAEVAGGPFKNMQGASLLCNLNFGF